MATVNAFSPCSLLLALGIPAVLSGIIVPRVVPVPLAHPIVPIAPVIGVNPIGAMVAASQARKGMMMKQAMAMGFNKGRNDGGRAKSKGLPPVFEKPESVLFDPYNNYQFPPKEVTKSLWTNKDFMLNGIGPVQGGHKLNVFHDINVERNYNFEHNFNVDGGHNFVAMPNMERNRMMNMDMDINMDRREKPVEVIVVENMGPGSVQDSRVMNSDFVVVGGSGGLQGGADHYNGFVTVGGDGLGSGVQVINAADHNNGFVTLGGGADHHNGFVTLGGNGGLNNVRVIDAGSSSGLGAVIASNDRSIGQEISLKDDMSYTKIPREAGRVTHIGVNDDNGKVHFLSQDQSAGAAIASNDMALGNQLVSQSGAAQDTIIIDQSQLGGHGLFDVGSTRGSNNRVFTSSDYPTPSGSNLVY